MQTTRTRAGMRLLLALLHTLAAALGLGAGFRFGLQAGGGYVLAGVAAVCFGIFCTLMLDALLDRFQHRRGH